MKSTRVEFVCDRCSFVKDVTNSDRSLWVALWAQHSVGDGNSTLWQRDLCPCCFSSLTKWFANPEAKSHGQPAS